MASFTITNSLYLRNFYNENRSLCIRSNRSDASTNKLNQADASALRRAVKSLGDFDFENATKSELTSELKAFLDTYNYTLDSAKNSTNVSIQSSYKGLKKLTQEYQKELENLGIKADANGYLKMSDSATKNIKGKRFGKFLGGDSEFVKQLGTYAKKISSHIDYIV